MNYITTELYKNLEKIKAVRQFLITIKNQFLSEEMFNAQLKCIDEEIQDIKNKIKKSL